LRRGEALGVEQLDHEESASSSLEGVIAMEGSCKYSLEAERDRTGSAAAALTFPSCSLATFRIRRILKRLRRSVGVDELDRTEPSDTAK